jgi:effector-binding domain-containing protein
MTKKVLLLVLLAVIIAAFFIPVTQQKSVLIKSSFLYTYSFLADPVKWEHWIPELHKTLDADSGKILVQKGNNSFTIKGENTEFRVKEQGTFFGIAEKTNNGSSNYIYSLVPVDDKFLNKTIVSVDQKLNLASYLTGKIWPSFNSDNHLSDLKTFMETDSLLYGFNIVKTVVPESNLIVIRKKVLNRDRFVEAAKMLTTLQVYVKVNNLKQMQPLIAQFTPVTKDSTQVKIGFFINKKVKGGNGIEFDRMPKGGLLYAARFRGKFYKRGQIYSAMKEYFSDHTIQTLLLPIETYLDNKLPVNDSDSIYIQLNFPALPQGQVH